MESSRLLEAITRLIEVSEITRRDRALKKVEKWLAGKMRTAFQAQEKAFFAALPAPVVKEAVGDEPVFPEWAAAWNAAEASTEAAFTGPIDEGIRISLVAGANNTVAQLEAGTTFTLEHPGAIKYAKQHAAEQVTKINGTTRDILNRIVVNGTEQGLSYGQIAKQIKDEFGEFAVSWPQEHIRNRAHAVAVFETGDAYEAGNRMVADELTAEGLEMEKFWQTVGDSRVRPSHSANQAQGWIPIDQSFQSGHDRSPTDPGCRCSTLYRVKPAEAA